MCNWKYYDPRKMTLQEIVTASVQHVLDQGKPSMGESKICLYRNSHGLQCGASIFISDEEYESNRNGVVFSDLPVSDELEGEKSETIEVLQCCHDAAARGHEHTSCDFISQYKERVVEKLSGSFILPPTVHE